MIRTQYRRVYDRLSPSVQHWIRHELADIKVPSKLGGFVTYDGATQMARRISGLLERPRRLRLGQVLGREITGLKEDTIHEGRGPYRRLCRALEHGLSLGRSRAHRIQARSEAGEEEARSFPATEASGDGMKFKIRTCPDCGKVESISQTNVAPVLHLWKGSCLAT